MNTIWLQLIIDLISYESNDIFSSMSFYIQSVNVFVGHF